MTSRSQILTVWLPPLWAAVLAVLLLGPALGPGYVLSYDMVWVPDLALRRDSLGVGTALPRAVPSDAVVAVLDDVLPGMVLQKVVLLGSLVGAGTGAALLGPTPGRPGALVGRLVATTLAVWSPFAVERLVLGHWPVLLCYGALPWAVLLARRARHSGRLPPALLLLLVVGSLSANAGLMTALVVLAFALDRRRPRQALTVAAAVLAANAPWVVAGLLHAPAAGTAASATRLFALNGTDSLPAPVAALGMGGVWNTEVVLASRDGAAAWAGVTLAVLLAALGVRPLVRTWSRRDVLALAGCWATGWLAAVLTWAAPDAVTWLAAHLPGAGVLRDGSRFLALCLPALALAAGHGAGLVAGRAPGGVARGAVGVTLVLAPVAVMPDAAAGASGRLRAVAFPEEYADARAAVRDHQAAGGAGDVVLLPFTSYRAPEWNGARKVLDPLGRYLPADFVASDVLVVDGVRVPGEDPRARAVERALRQPDEQRVDALARLGIGLVVEEDAEGAVTVTRLDGVVEQRVPTGWWAAMVAAWGCFAMIALAGVVSAAPAVLGGLGKVRASQFATDE